MKLYFLGYARSLVHPSRGSGIHAQRHPETKKYPSDNETGELPKPGIFSVPPSFLHPVTPLRGPETRKYPSDDETGILPPHQV